MSPSQTEQEEDRIEYLMWFPEFQNFKMFIDTEEHVELAGIISVPPLTERGKLLPIEPIES